MKIIVDKNLQNSTIIQQIYVMCTLAGYSVLTPEESIPECIKINEEKHRFLLLAPIEKVTEFREMLKNCPRLERVLWVYKGEISKSLNLYLGSGEITTLLSLDSGLPRRLFKALSRIFVNRYRPIGGEFNGYGSYGHSKILDENSLNAFRDGLKLELGHQLQLLSQATKSTFISRVNWLVDELMINAQKVSEGQPFEASWLWNGEQIAVEVLDYRGSLSVFKVFERIFSGSNERSSENSLGLGWQLIWKHCTELVVVVSRDKFTAVQAVVPLSFSKLEHDSASKNIEVYQL